MSDGPAPPDSLPKYLSEGLPKQSDETLREVKSWIDELLEYRDRPLDESEVVDMGEQVEEVDESSSKGTKVVKKVPCGKDNCKCASGAESDLHGPYVYYYRREGDKVVSEYAGKAE